MPEARPSRRRDTRHRALKKQKERSQPSIAGWIVRCARARDPAQLRNLPAHRGRLTRKWWSRPSGQARKALCTLLGHPSHAWSGSPDLPLLTRDTKLDDDVCVPAIHASEGERRHCAPHGEGAGEGVVDHVGRQIFRVVLDPVGERRRKEVRSERLGRDSSDSPRLRAFNICYVP